MILKFEVEISTKFLACPWHHLLLKIGILYSVMIKLDVLPVLCVYIENTQGENSSLFHVSDLIIDRV